MHHPADGGTRRGTRWRGGASGLMPRTDKGKVTKASVKARLAEIQDDKEAIEERKMLKEYLALIDKESEANKKVKGCDEGVGGQDLAQVW